MYLKKLLPLAIVASIPAYAAETGITEKMENVLVSATRFEGPKMPTASSITVIDREQIKLSGARRVVDILRAQAGIQLQDNIGNGTRAAVSMRGFGANASSNALILIDGRKLNNPSMEAADLSAISVKDIERIEIVQGSAGVLFGDQAVGGVINIITQRATDTELHGTVEVQRGSDDLERYIASLKQGFDNGISYRVSAEKQLADNYRDNNESDYSNTLVNVRLDKGWGNVFVESQLINDDLNLPGSISAAQEQADRRQTTTPDDFSNRNSLLNRVGGQIKLSEHWKAAMEASLRDTDGEFVLYWSPANQDTRVKSYTPRIEGVYDTTFGKTIVTLGYDKTESDFQLAYTGLSWASDYNADQDIDAYYGQIIYPAAAQLTVSMGVRHSKLKEKNLLSGEINNDDAEAYEFGASYQVSDQLRLFGRYADAFRFAKIDENGFTAPGLDFLKPQTSESLEAGVEWQAGVTTVKATAYDMDIDNEIMFDAFEYVNTNLDSSNRKGLILEASRLLSDNLELLANYTYTDAKFTGGNFDGNQVPFVAENQVTVGVTYTFLSAWSIYLDAEYKGSRYAVDDEANAGDKLDSDLIFNANLGWTLGQWQAGIRIDNLTDKDYETYRSIYDYMYTAPGRVFSASISYSF